MSDGKNLYWLVCACLLACESQCALDDDLRRFAGDGARDCGDVPLGEDRSRADACVAAAFEAEEAFIVRYSRRGFDSKVVTAVASNTVGSVKLFQWDSAPCGGSGCDPVTDVQSCDEPSLNLETAEDPDALPISCVSLGTPERVCE